MSRRNSLWIGLLAAGILIGLVTAYLYFANFYPQINESNRDTVVRAIYAYQQDYGKFPDRLTDLAPKYLSVFPKDAIGKSMFYSTDPYNGFIVSYYVRQNFGCGFSDREQEWGCGFGD